MLLIRLLAFKHEAESSDCLSSQACDDRLEMERKLSKLENLTHSCALSLTSVCCCVGWEKLDSDVCVCERNFMWLEKKLPQCGYWIQCVEWEYNTLVTLECLAVWANFMDKLKTFMYERFVASSILNTWQRISFFVFFSQKIFFWCFDVPQFPLENNFMLFWIKWYFFFDNCDRSFIH